MMSVWGLAASSVALAAENALQEEVAAKSIEVEAALEKVAALVPNLVGRSVAGRVITDVLGMGEVSAVFATRHHALGRDEVLKVLRETIDLEHTARRMPILSALRNLPNQLQSWPLKGLLNHCCRSQPRWNYRKCCGTAGSAVEMLWNPKKSDRGPSERSE